MQRGLSFYRPDSAVYGNRFRSKRLLRFLQLVDAQLARTSICRVLDLGGEITFWKELEPIWRDRPVQITIVNRGERFNNDPRFHYLSADARDLARFPDESFDVVHSNSVIEHVGAWTDMRLMAGEVRRLAPAYFVQTPNFWFPFDPHMRTPLIHWLPAPVQAQIVMRRACGFFPQAGTMDEAQEILADAVMLDAAMMEALFPDARIVREKIGPLTKSLLAIRTAA